MNFEALGLPLTTALFVAAGMLVWISGTALSRSADVIAERTGLGRAFTGVLLLGAATSLPELATTITASVGGHASMAGNNLLGGVAMQIAVLAVADAFGVPGKPLTFFSATPVFLVQGVMLLIMLAIACAAVAAGEFVSIGGVGGWSLLLGATYVVALYLMYRYERDPQWTLSEPQARRPVQADASSWRDRATSAVVLRFAVACAGVLVGGYLVAESGAAIAEQTGIDEGFVGATLVAVTTTLPEVSTTLAAVRLGAYSMAAGNILGTNILEVALFLPADALYRGGPIFAAMGEEANLLTALGIALTCIYLWGALERKDRAILGLGIDSALVLLTYAGGILLYYRLTG